MIPLACHGRREGGEDDVGGSDTGPEKQAA